MNLLKALEKQIFTKERLCCQSGGTLKVLCILSCLQGIKPLIQTCSRSTLENLRHDPMPIHNVATNRSEVIIELINDVSRNEHPRKQSVVSRATLFYERRKLLLYCLSRRLGIRINFYLRIVGFYSANSDINNLSVIVAFVCDEQTCRA
ncbi:hypothetical protein DMN91_003895 [Ooceraea biroi]|uniref:Uncharacterized protein n=1 Tax=Ooceraea biroi TaxID=2015173 RepID=A0A3L8DUX6_OOCBI|nr:hypothetical protein DMN91_003895 [Ooceraea biroi]